MRISDWSSDVCSSDLVRLVDAHAEGDGRHHDDPVLLEEAVLMTGAAVLVEPGMVGQRRITLSGEPCCNLVDPRARQAVDDAGVAGVLREEGLEIGRASCRERVCQYV